MLSARSEETPKATFADMDHLLANDRPAAGSPPSERLRLALLGDCMLGRLVNETLRDVPPEYPWGDTLPLLRGADWRLCNLECVLSDRGAPVFPKTFHFRSDARNIAVLRAARIDAVTLANNHVLDYGNDAMSEMLEILDRAGVVHSGAGKNFDEASLFATAAVRGTKLAMLAFTDNEPGWEAGAGRPGIFYAPIEPADPRARMVLEIVSRGKPASDFLIVSAHWGPNWGYAPPREHVEFARALIDAGADIVFGHSSHVFRGIEFYRGRAIVYGAGDFVDDYMVDEIERNDQGFVYVVEVEGGIQARLRLYPTVIGNCQACHAGGHEERAIAAKMRKLCGPFGTRALWDPASRSLVVEPTPQAKQSAGENGRFQTP
jgi:poly-gamma-glutamate capsule biosynthesis protein CapA/YwtB (metallophosphatase superfamily)